MNTNIGQARIKFKNQIKMWNKTIDNRKEGKGDFVATMSMLI